MPLAQSAVTPLMPQEVPKPDGGSLMLLTRTIVEYLRREQCPREVEPVRVSGYSNEPVRPVVKLSNRQLMGVSFRRPKTYGK